MINPELELRQRMVLHHMRAFLDTCARTYHPPFVNNTEQTIMQAQDGRESTLAEIIARHLQPGHGAHRELAELKACHNDPLGYWWEVRVIGGLARRWRGFLFERPRLAAVYDWLRSVAKPGRR